MEKVYYKLTVEKTVSHELITACIQAFWLMELCHGRKWLTFWGQSSDLEGAAFVLKAEGITCKLTTYRGPRH